jgi:hypothetical protein
MPPDIFETLNEMADEEFRDVHNHAAWLLREAVLVWREKKKE